MKKSVIGGRNLKWDCDLCWAIPIFLSHIFLCRIFLLEEENVGEENIPGPGVVYF
jgi:hypothetical protein